MQEIEVKILDINLEKTATLLESKGAKKVSDEVLDAYFYRNTAGAKLRLRRMGTRTILTYKQKNSYEGVMRNEEYEVEVSHFEDFVEILTGIGFEQYGSSTKRRITYTLGEAHYDLDKYEGIPWLIEVEGQTQEAVEAGVALLGYTMDDTCTITERQVKEKYGL